jgi:hypothetical protein
VTDAKAWSEPDPASVAEGPRSRLAVAVFVLSLVWLLGFSSVVAIVLGVIALARIKRLGQRGWGLAFAAVVLGLVGVVVGFCPTDIR